MKPCVFFSLFAALPALGAPGVDRRALSTTTKTITFTITSTITVYGPAPSQPTSTQAVTTADAPTQDAPGVELPCSTANEGGVAPMPTFTQDATSVITTTTVTPDVSITTIATTSGTVQVLPDPGTLTPSSQGTVMTSLETSGVATTAPVISTSIAEPGTTIATSEVTSVPTSVATDAPSANIFQPIATGAPHGAIPTRDDHPVRRLGISQKSPLSTNKFYGNFFLGDQNGPTWTHPYSVAWAKGGGPTNSWGIAVSHIDENQRDFGAGGQNNPTFLANPIGIQSLILSASELGSGATLSTNRLTAFSAHISLSSGEGQPPAITFPVVQGMGFVTGIYNGVTPTIHSGVMFRTLTRADNQPKPGVTKYRIELEDGKLWYLYATSADGLSLDLQLVNSRTIQATSNFNGFIQVAKNSGSGESIYDGAAGNYAEDVELSGSVDGTVGSYTLSFKKAGLFPSALLMFALPHHVQTLSSQTASGLTDLKLVTTTKGQATAIIGDAWTLVENLPTSMGFAPWSPETGSVEKLSDEAIAAIKDVAASEVSQDMAGQSNLDSMYFSGKALAKFAGIVYTLNDLLDEKALGQAGLTKLKEAFSTFVKNKQVFPLVYESVWGGVVSSSTYSTGDIYADFGNAYYNDHHFHYGYFVYTAAVIAHLDPSALEDSEFTSFVNTLLRDISNPSPLDPYFPVQRAYDYFHGHSWAKGLFPSFDGKDQESSSEDMMFAYAIKAWGLATGDSNTIARGNLQLAVTARSIKNYFVYESDNAIQPAAFIKNKVSGILFENKIDHTTYFGANIEYIQGIHMLPLLPCTALSRSKKFVQEEWDTYFSNGRADQINAGWRGILYGNLIRVAPQTSWDFFKGASADLIDGGASRTWYMAFAAAMRDGAQQSGPEPSNPDPAPVTTPDPPKVINGNPRMNMTWNGVVYEVDDVDVKRSLWTRLAARLTTSLLR